jgi:HK97 gp10 family phage protein
MIEIRSYLDSEAIDRAVVKGLTKIGAQIVAYAKSVNIPDTGALRNSIMYKTYVSSGGFNDSGGEPAPKEITPVPKKDELYVGSNLEYAIYQEFGTRYMAARPYMRPAIARITKGTAADIIQKQIEDETAKGPLKKGAKIKRFF